jgi:hypothetical protein
MTDSPIANLVPPTPRPVTKRASARSWAELTVQKWWKSALLVAVVMLGVTFGQLREYMRTQALVKNGLPVKAQVVELVDRKIGTGSYHPMRDVELPARLTGTLPNGDPWEFKGMLPKAEGFVGLGEFMDLRVDPNDHSNWIEVGKTPSLSQQFIAVYLLLPVVVLLLAYAQWQRMKMLKVWKRGRLREAIVVDSKHSALSPRSRICRYTIAEGDDRRVFTTLYPTKHGIPERGHVLDMIVLPDQPERGIVADFYVREVTA